MSTRYLVIEFIDGKKETFTFPEQTTSDAAKKLNIEGFLQSPWVVVETENEVMAFPVANIKCLHFSGMVDDRHSLPLPAVAIRGAEQR
ncbi:hypothetical protein GCM10025771_39600 [Niveibacterium umoris]|uniref:Uncharacterized protein n=1 Tax=Niveibacterium umoris TaxID=1193620 RepID=A0A840BGN6_9RHOO|nr:hypothetical protein [Niveibacterium umoris]MBB4010838.1 hypothetical protein [Niveibacterium umoris]